MGVGQLSESDAVDALRLPIVRAIPQGHMVGGISLIWAIPIKTKGEIALELINAGIARLGASNSGSDGYLRQ